jgi:hypothetical protein
MANYNKRDISDKEFIILKKKDDSIICNNPDLIFFTSDLSLISKIDSFLASNLIVTFNHFSNTLSTEKKSGSSNFSLKNQVKSDIKNFTISRLDPFLTIDIVSYLDISLELMEKGYIITDNSRDEKYLELLSTGDQSLIDLLEKYLTLKDKLSLVKNIKSNCDYHLDLLDNLDDTLDSDIITINDIRKKFNN